MPVVTTVSALKENSPQEFEVDGTDVVLVRTNGEVFAVGAICTLSLIHISEPTRPY